MNTSCSRLPSIGMTVAFTACALCTASLVGQENAATSDRRVAALRLALAANLDYCRDWLEGKDFKSLSKTAGGAVILADMLARQGDGPPWQQATGRFADAARLLDAAAKQAESSDPPDFKACRDQLAQVQVELKALAAGEPSGKPQQAGPRPPLRPLMYLQEAILSDAKTALAAGEAKNAKLNALVLSELGQAVLNYHSDAQWSASGQDFMTAVRALADSASDDPQVLRPLVRAVGQRCEACHRMR
jgi:hypothetical protein